jgi:hypothetical protein
VVAASLVTLIVKKVAQNTESKSRVLEEAENIENESEVLITNNVMKNKPSGDPNWSAIGFKELVNNLKNEKLSGLQKEALKEKYKNKLVQWDVVLRSVESMWKNKNDSDIVIVISPIDSKEDRIIGSAVLNHKYKEDLLELSENDELTLNGKITFSDISEAISLKKCELVSYAKNPNKNVNFDSAKNMPLELH